LEDCDAVLEAAATLRFGSLRVGLDSPFRAMALVGRFANEHPDVRVQTSMGNAGATLVRLLDGESDVAIFTLVPGERGKLGHLHLIELGHQGVRLLVPRVHALNQGVPVAVKSLANHPFVMREPGSATRATVESLLRQARISPRISFEFGSREAVREAVAAGLGVSLVIEGEEGSDPRLVSVDLADVQSDATLVVACLAERREQPAVRAFLQLVAGDD
jgi:DNA-binding transcriptional LysR family regulator